MAFIKMTAWEQGFPAKFLTLQVVNNLMEFVSMEYPKCPNIMICLVMLILASCPWGPLTANGVDLLTEMYVIYIEIQVPRSIGCSRRAFNRQKEGKLTNI